MQTVTECQRICKKRIVFLFIIHNSTFLKGKDDIKNPVTLLRPNCTYEKTTKQKNQKKLNTSKNYVTEEVVFKCFSCYIEMLPNIL